MVASSYRARGHTSEKPRFLFDEVVHQIAQTARPPAPRARIGSTQVPARCPLRPRQWHHSGTGPIRPEGYTLETSGERGIRTPGTREGSTVLKRILRGGACRALTRVFPGPGRFERCRG